MHKRNIFSTHLKIKQNMEKKTSQAAESQHTKLKLAGGIANLHFTTCDLAP
jgi:hypothetical protein